MLKLKKIVRPITCRKPLSIHRLGQNGGTVCCLALTFFLTILVGVPDLLRGENDLINKSTYIIDVQKCINKGGIFTRRRVPFKKNNPVLL